MPGKDGRMNARSMHPAGRGAYPGPLHGGTMETGSPVTYGPACCCPAIPVVRVIMPATTARPHDTELLLCGHHYRISRGALASADATVAELLGPAGSPPHALLPDIPHPRVPVI
jgi:hypothetical protein